MKIIFLSFIFSFIVITGASAQWSLYGNNLSYGKLTLGNGTIQSPKLYVQQNATDFTASFQSTNGKGLLINTISDPLLIGTTGNSSGNIFIVDESGSVGINTGPSFHPSYKLHVGGHSLVDGTVRANIVSANTYYTTSDRNLKKNIKENFSSFNRLYDIKTYDYELKAEGNGKTHFGVMAQEIAEIYPDLVMTNEDNELAVNYIELIPQMIRALQEQKLMMNATLEKMSAMQEEITSLKSKLASTENLKTMNQWSVLYPNPASNSATIQLSNVSDLENAMVELIDLNSKVILTRTFDGKSSLSMDTSGLTKGVYFIRLTDGLKQIETKRLLIE